MTTRIIYGNGQVQKKSNCECKYKSKKQKSKKRTNTQEKKYTIKKSTNKQAIKKKQNAINKQASPPPKKRIISPLIPSLFIFPLKKFAKQACKHRTNNFPYHFVSCRFVWPGRRKSTQWVQTSIF